MRQRGLLFAEGLILIGLAAYWFSVAGSEVPVVRWRFEDLEAPVEPYRTVPPETAFRLELDLPFGAWTYVVGYDTVRGSIAMYPSSFLNSDLEDNPLPAGEHAFPGRAGDLDLWWHAGDAPGPVSFMVVVSRRPIRELEDARASFRQMGNAAFPGRPKLGVYAPRGGMERVPPFSRVHTDVLRAAFELADGHDGAMQVWSERDGVYLKTLRLRVEAPQNPESGLRERVEGALGEAFGPAEPRQETGPRPGAGRD